MPWCEECAKYWTPNAMNEDGTCPRCGAQVEAASGPGDVEAGDEKAPWHFKLLVAATVFYLGWRFLQILS